MEKNAKALQEYRKVMLASPLTPEEYITKEFFTRNTVPKEESEYWVVPQTPQDFRLTLSKEGFPVIYYTPVEDFTVYEIYRSSAEEDQPTLIYRQNPETNNTIEWKDTLVEPGKTYNYFIIPVHPDIILEDKPLQGASTKVLSIKVPGIPSPSLPDENNEDDTDEQSDIPTIELEIS